MPDTSDVLNEITIDIDQVPEGTNLVSLIGTAARAAEPDWGTSWVLTATHFESTIANSSKSPRMSGLI